jgi:hypothetical protein
MKFLDLVVQKNFQEIMQDIGFSSNIFMIYGLPTRRLQGNPAFWKKQTSLCTLTVTRDENQEIPYGCYARMNQIFIDTEVRTKNTNIIDVGKSFREYTHKVGYLDGRANRALLRQLLNYVTSVVKVEPKDTAPGHFMGIHSVVARAWDIHFDVKNPEQLMLEKGKIVLDAEYAKWIHDHSAPLDMNVIRAFSRNPLALDFYRFLAYRNNELTKPISLQDFHLFGQLGTQQEEHKVTRARLRRILKAIQMYWPVKAKLEDGYFQLEPSQPAVPHTIPSKHPIIIVDKHAP